MSQVYYAYDAKNYQHYLFGDGNIWRFNAFGEDYKEIPYTWLPIMKYMSQVNVVSVLYVTDGVRTQLEVAYNYGTEFGKYTKDVKDLIKCLKLDSNANCIAKLKRKGNNGILQTIFVFNTLENELFTLLKQQKF